MRGYSPFDPPWPASPWQPAQVIWISRPFSRFCATVGKVLHRPSWLPVPGFALHLALGEVGTLMTTGQRVDPAKARAGGYTFRYPTLEPALRAIVNKEDQACLPSSTR